MKKYNILLALLFILTAAFIGMNCSSDILKIARAPVIGSLDATSYEVDPGDTVTVTVTVQEANGEVLRYEWNASRGELLPPVNQSTVQWVAPQEGGIVRITVWVSNEDKSSTQSIQVNVRSYTNPYIVINAPQPDTYFVLNDEVEIEATASHNNGIEWVYLYVDDAYIMQLNRKVGLDNVYSCTYRFQNMTGEIELKVSTRARTTGTFGMDSLSVFVEGIIPGKR
ncbi:hypothetical protein HQ585_17130 [candidate division KSB1 bacterium]|nr:hypothetical protein [candidate division KSB1 bacterium]